MPPPALCMSLEDEVAGWNCMQLDRSILLALLGMSAERPLLATCPQTHLQQHHVSRALSGRRLHASVVTSCDVSPSHGADLTRNKMS